jgi:3-oxoacyl-(acyl-carrier-protein) synthase
MNIMAATATIAMGARATSVTLNQPTAAGDLAVAHAAAMVAAGRIPAALAGGVDEISPTVYRMLSQFRALSPMDGGSEGCFPFDRRQNGPVLGEGATFVLLEPMDAARERGAPIYAEIRGAAWACQPAGRGRVPRRPANGSAIARALALAALPPERITWAYLTGTGDPPLDDWELSLMCSAFGGNRPRLTSLTPLAGDHGGLGALRVAAAAWTARTRHLPPLAGLRDPVRADCLFATPGATDPGAGAGLVHGVARGGTQVAIVVALPEDVPS